MNSCHYFLFILSFSFFDSIFFFLLYRSQYFLSLFILFCLSIFYLSSDVFFYFFFSFSATNLCAYFRWFALDLYADLSWFCRWFIGRYRVFQWLIYRRTNQFRISELTDLRPDTISKTLKMQRQLSSKHCGADGRKRKTLIRFQRPRCVCFIFQWLSSVYNITINFQVLCREDSQGSPHVYMPGRRKRYYRLLWSKTRTHRPSSSKTRGVLPPDARKTSEKTNTIQSPMILSATLLCTIKTKLWILVIIFFLFCLFCLYHYFLSSIPERCDDSVFK